MNESVAVAYEESSLYASINTSGHILSIVGHISKQSSSGFLSASPLRSSSQAGPTGYVHVLVLASSKYTVSSLSTESTWPASYPIGPAAAAAASTFLARAIINPAKQTRR